MVEKWILILVVALLVLGPQKLLYVSRFFGTSYGKLKGQWESLQKEVGLEALKGTEEGFDPMEPWGATPADRELIAKTLQKANRPAEHQCVLLQMRCTQESHGGAKVQKQQRRAWRVYKAQIKRLER